MRTLLVLVLVVAGRVLGDELEDWDRMMQEPVDKLSWVDPNDMGLHDPRSLSCRELEARVARCDKELEGCRIEAATLAREGANTSQADKKTPDTVFLRRHVTHLISTLGLEPGAAAHLKLEVFLSADQTRTLRNFAAPKSSVPAVDVDTILSSFIHSVETFETSPFVDNLKETLTSLRDPLLVVLMSFALVYLAMIIFRHLPPAKVLGLVLAVSLVWHSVLLYKDAVATQQVKLMADTPPECRPGEMSVLQSVRSFVSQGFSSVDKCAEYQKALLVDPIYEINPLTTSVDLCTKLVLHPLSKLGEAVGKMFSGLLNNVPFIYQLPLLLLFCLVLLFTLLLVFGYRIRLPFFLGEISPASAPSPGRDVIALELSNKALQLEVAQLKQLMSGPQLVAVTQQKQVTRQDSGAGVEELLALASHHHQQQGPNVEAQPSTPSKHSNQKVAPLTLVQSRQRHRSRSDSDVTPISTGEEVDGSQCPSRKRSDSLPRTPNKSLLVKGCDSPQTTKFEWVEVHDDESIEANKNNVIKKNLCESDFLDKVEEIFESKTQ